MFRRRFFPAVSGIVMAAGLVSTGASWASSYAVSTNSITGFDLNLPLGSTFQGLTFSGDIAVALGDLTGGDVNIAAQDAAAACVGAYCAGFNNSFGFHGASLYPGYAYGDALIGNSNVLGGTGTASSIGEATAFNGIAGAAGANTMIASFTLGSAGTLSFSFLSDLYMNTQLGSGGLFAKSDSGMNISIWSGTILTGLTTQVFEWKPDGAAGGILNGSETSDPFSLNHNIAGNLTYDPLADTFSAMTNVLAGGTYTMKIRMDNSAAVSAVPVPAALPLFGSGLLALMALVRRRRART